MREAKELYIVHNVMIVHKFIPHYIAQGTGTLVNITSKLKYMHDTDED